MVPKWLTILAVAAPVAGVAAGWGTTALMHAKNAAVRQYQDSVHDYWIDQRIRRIERRDDIEDAQKQSEHNDS
ncbi:hypothetical protein KGP36_01585 [Patescibacteria group bacterium]|nr:hypothetical protein [Patescibacteria group bacterium]